MAEPARLHRLPDHAPPTRPARSRPALFSDMLPDEPLEPAAARGPEWFAREAVRLVFILVVVAAGAAFLWAHKG